MSDNAETAILAGGCFWGVQELLRHRDGVISSRVGYSRANRRTKREGLQLSSASTDSPNRRT
jgi:peptide methionine sulfoxide reductase MsrA